MSVNKIDRRALKKPDQFQVFVLGLFDKLRANATPIVGAVVAALVIAVGIVAFIQFGEGKAEEAQYRFGSLQQKVTEARAMDSSEARSEALREVARDLQTFYSEYEGTDAGRNALFTIGQVHFSLGNHESAANAFEQAAKRTGKLPNFQAMAFVEAGKSWEALGQYDKAIEFYQKAGAIEGNPYAQVVENDIARLKALQNGSAPSMPAMAPEDHAGHDH